MALVVGVYCRAQGAKLPACTLNEQSQRDLASVVCSMRLSMHADMALAADPIEAGHETLGELRSQCIPLGI